MTNDLMKFSTAELLGLKFNKNERFKSGSISEWMKNESKTGNDKSPLTQLKDYVQKLKLQTEKKKKKIKTAHSIVVIDCQRIIIAKLDFANKNFSFVHSVDIDATQNT
jgi:hypothetical protein